MNDLTRNRLQMFRRVQAFGIARTTDFPTTSLGGQVFAIVAAAVAELDGHAATQASGFGAEHEGTTTRNEARTALAELMKAITRTARAMAEDTPGLDDKFRMPRGINDEALLAAARAFATDALPLKDQFIAHELPATFIDDLNHAIADLEQAINQQGEAVGDHVSARVAMSDAVDRGLSARNKLDAIVKNKYAHDPAALAEWASASHVERSPKRKHASSPATAVTPTPPAKP